MQSEAYCEHHGAYDASLNACPLCSSSKNAVHEPTSLEDDPPTVTWRGSGSRAHGDPDHELTVAAGDGSAPGSMGFVDDWPEIRQGSWHAEEELPPWPKRQDQPATADDVTRVRAPRKDAVKDGVKAAHLDETVILREETGLLGFLIVKRGSQRGKVYPIKHGATVGGSGADVVLGDPTVDAVHAKFTIEEECFYVWDFGTEHGTSVNGAKIREATPVQENDIIGFGQTELELKTLQ